MWFPPLFAFRGKFFLFLFFEKKRKPLRQEPDSFSQKMVYQATPKKEVSVILLFAGVKPAKGGQKYARREIYQGGNIRVAVARGA